VALTGAASVLVRRGPRWRDHLRPRRADGQAHL